MPLSKDGKALSINTHKSGDRPLSSFISRSRSSGQWSFDMSRSIALVLGISFLGVCSHLIPHEMGVSTVGAVSLIAAAYLPRSLMLIPVLITVLVADAVHGFYGALAMFFVYLGHPLQSYPIQHFH